MDRIDAVVIGAGAVGLAVGRALAQAGHETVVLESQSGIGQGVSSRNSEVLHAGLYYAPGSLKARLCVRGQALLYDFCTRHGVPHRACGKLVVATAEDQHAALLAVQRRARANGAVVEAWTAAAARALEPELHCTAALWSPLTGIVDSHAYMLALQGDLERAGGAVAVKSPVRSWVALPGGGARLVVDAAEGPFEVEAGLVVNAAGLSACALTQALAGLLPVYQCPPRYAKGSYFTLAGRSPFRHLVYPAPVDAWLGVHVTIDLGGQARFGPDFEWLDTTDPRQIDYAVNPARAAAFEAAIRRYWPGLPDKALQPGYSGVRPKIHGPGEATPDFRIQGPAQHGLRGIVNLLGIESPGLTASLAIAEDVLERLAVV
jgi:L-2-hydroxyglutarate oxidase LhgO